MTLHQILKPVFATLALLLVAAPTFAAGKIDPPTSDERWVRAMEAIEVTDYPKAIRELRAILQDDPDNADAWNWLGFAARHVDKLDLSWDAYDRALSIDPEHVGAMNYLGRLYLEREDLASAEEMVERLAETCGDCDELTQLADAVQSAEN